MIESCNFHVHFSYFDGFLIIIDAFSQWCWLWLRRSFLLNLLVPHFYLRSFLGFPMPRLHFCIDFYFLFSLLGLLIGFHRLSVSGFTSFWIICIILTVSNRLGLLWFPFISVLLLFTAVPFIFIWDLIPFYQVCSLCI
jgi:hypothetical protein